MLARWRLVRHAAFSLRFLMSAPRYFTVVLLTGIVGASLALAQEAVAPVVEPVAPESEEETTPAAQYTEEAIDALNSMKLSLQKGLDELKKARDEKDALRMTCVSEPVGAMKGVLRVAEDANVDMQEALGSSQAADARRDFRKVQKSRQRMDSLLSEAQNCAGAESSVSTTSLEVSIDEDYVAIDPYYGDPDFFFDPAGAASAGNTDQLNQTDPPTVRPPVASGIF